MSGGVDSSATAALLKSEATTSSHHAAALTIMVLPPIARAPCCAGQDIHDARDVAERIGIPHYVLDYGKPFP